MAPLLTELMQVFPVQLPDLATLEKPGLVSAQGGSGEATLGVVIVDKAALGSNPGGTPTKSFIWRQTDKVVTLYWMIKFPTAGSLINAFSVPFPTSCPVPWQFAEQENNAWVYPGDGGLFPSLTVNLISTSGAMAGIYRESTGDLTLKATSGPTALSGKNALGIVKYLTTA